MCVWGGGEAYLGEASVWSVCEFVWEGESNLVFLVATMM